MLDISMHSIDQDLDVFSPRIESFTCWGDDGVRGIWRREERGGKGGRE